MTDLADPFTDPDIGDLPADAPPTHVMAVIQRAMGNFARPTPTRVSAKGKRIGRPPRLHPKVQETICDFIRRGAPKYAAAKAAGIDVSTLNNWIGRGEEARVNALNGIEVPTSERAYFLFLLAVEEARGQGEVVVAAKMREVAMGEAVRRVTIEEETDPDTGEPTGAAIRTIEFQAPNVRALGFLLEYGYGWTKKTEVELSGPGGGPVPLEVEVSARDVLRKRLGAVSERLGVDPTTPIDADSTPVELNPPKETP